MFTVPQTQFKPSTSMRHRSPQEAIGHSPYQRILCLLGNLTVPYHVQKFRHFGRGPDKFSTQPHTPLKVPLQFNTLPTTTTAKIHQYIQRKDKGSQKCLHSSMLAIL